MLGCPESPVPGGVGVKRWGDCFTFHFSLDSSKVSSNAVFAARLFTTARRWESPHAHRPTISELVDRGNVACSHDGRDLDIMWMKLETTVFREGSQTRGYVWTDSIYMKHPERGGRGEISDTNCTDSNVNVFRKVSLRHAKRQCLTDTCASCQVLRELRLCGVMGFERHSLR